MIAMKDERTKDEKELYGLCVHGTHEQIAALLERGVNPNVPYWRKERIGACDPPVEWVWYLDYPIHQAAFHQSVETVRMLVSKGVNPKVKDFWNSEPLMYASIAHNVEVIKYLVEDCGNDPGWQNDDGDIPYWKVRDMPELCRWMVAKAKECNPEHEEWYEDD